MTTILAYGQGAGIPISMAFLAYTLLLTVIIALLPMSRATRIALIGFLYGAIGIWWTQ